MGAPVSDEAPGAGTVLAQKYRVERVLGSGGMGVVLEATHVQLEDQVAIKLLHPQVARRPGAIDRFLREARVAMKLRGEHVVRIHDLGTMDDGLPFIVMEYLEGGDLASLLRVRGTMSVADAADCVLQACVGVAEAHALGVVHRDLKPPNLFLTTRVDKTPCVKVLDFGISKVLREGQMGTTVLDDTAPGSIPPPSEKPSTLGWADTVRAPRRADATGTHGVMGSPRYMAPEQIRCARDVDARADIWSLGVILYELVTGVPPFDGDGLEQLKCAILEGRARPLKLLCTVPPAFETFMAKCLAKQPADRFADVRAFAEALASFASEEGRASLERIVRMAPGERVGTTGSWTFSRTASGRGGPLAGRRSRALLAAKTLAAVSLAALGVLAAVRAARVPASPVLAMAPSLAPIEKPFAVEVSHLAREDVAAPSPASSDVQSSDRAPPPSHSMAHPRTKQPSQGAALARRDAASRPDPLELDGGFLFDEQH